MNHDDPRLKHGIHVRAKLYRPNDGEDVIAEGYVINPKQLFTECATHPVPFPQGWQWCGIATVHGHSWTAEEFHRLTEPGSVEWGVLSTSARAPLPLYWLQQAQLGDIEYLDAGFSGPVKPKNRRGKHHRMRVKP